MIIKINEIEEKELQEFKGGEGSLLGRTFSDDNVKIMKGILKKGSSIGYHTHENSSEIIFALKGSAEVNYNGKILTLNENEVHYCPQGSSHGLTNLKEKPFEFYCVVPQY